MKRFVRTVIVERDHKSANDRRRKILWVVAEYRDEENNEFRKAFEFNNKAHLEDCEFPLYLD